MVDEQGRTEPPVAAGEAETLLGFLDFQRATFAWKCNGLDAAGLAATLAPSTMTLGGMMKHLALVKHRWCSMRLHGRPYGPPWDAVDWDADRDWDRNSAADDSPERLRQLWQDTGEQSRADVAAALADGGLACRRPAVAGRAATDGAVDPVPPHRGVRPARRSRRPPARVR